jgi:hypothetical protein
MARRKEAGLKEYNPLDDARGRLPIDQDLIRDVVADRTPVQPRPPAEDRPHLPVFGGSHAAPGLAAATMAAPELARDERAQPRGITLEKLTAYNKFLTTPTEKLELDRLAAHVSGALGVSVKSSQLIRACLVLLLRAENEVIRRAERQPRIKRPSNTEAVALAEFDQLLADVLSQSFRDAFPPKRP